MIYSICYKCKDICDRCKHLLEAAQAEVDARWKLYEYLAANSPPRKL
ncbi:hypothetical protein [Chlorogloeopsis sp. ULAP02]